VNLLPRFYDVTSGKVLIEGVDIRDIKIHDLRAHIGLVTQNQDCLGSVVPSKIYGLMAAGRPALFIGPKEATPSQIIRRFNCGWQVDCRDSDKVVALLKALAADMELVQQAGLRALEQAAFPSGIEWRVWWIEHNRRLKDPNVPDRYEVWDNNDRRDLIIDLQMKKAWIRDGDQWERVPDSDLR
jgi:hypothetical protein